MNEGLKEALKTQGQKMRNALYCADMAKAALDKFDANTRIAVKGDGLKRTEADTDAAVLSAPKRDTLAATVSETKSELEGVKVDTQCLLAEVSLVCSETAAMSRISH